MHASHAYQHLLRDPARQQGLRCQRGPQLNACMHACRMVGGVVDVFMLAGPTLEEVVRFYSELPGEQSIGHREETLKPLNLNEQEVAALVAFLRSLTSEVPVQVGPRVAPPVDLAERDGFSRR